MHGKERNGRRITRFFPDENPNQNAGGFEIETHALIAFDHLVEDGTLPPDADPKRVIETGRAIIPQNPTVTDFAATIIEGAVRSSAESIMYHSSPETEVVRFPS